jgi:hypothetical protein
MPTICFFRALHPLDVPPYGRPRHVNLHCSEFQVRSLLACDFPNLVSPEVGIKGLHLLQPCDSEGQLRLISNPPASRSPHPHLHLPDPALAARPISCIISSSLRPTMFCSIFGWLSAFTRGPDRDAPQIEPPALVAEGGPSRQALVISTEKAPPQDKPYIVTPLTPPRYGQSSNQVPITSAEHIYFPNREIAPEKLPPLVAEARL